MRSPFGGMGGMGNIEDMMEGFMGNPYGNPRHAINRHGNLGGRQNQPFQGQMISETRVFSSKMGPDGQMVTKKYFSKGRGGNVDGKYVRMLPLIQMYHSHFIGI